MSRAFYVAVALNLCFLSKAGAQGVGTLPDTLRGIVLGPGGKGVSSARITIVSPTLRRTTSVETGPDGTFTSIISGGGGKYVVVVTAPRLGEKTLQVSGRPGSTIQVPDVHLAFTPTMLAPVKVRASVVRADPVGSQTGGAAEEFFSSDQLDKYLPNFTSLEVVGLLIPGAVIGGDGSGGASYSVAGSPPSQNNVTLDGTTSQGRIPRDAVAGTTATINTADVTRGGFSGAQVAAYSASGSRIRRNMLRTALTSLGTSNGPFAPRAVEGGLSALDVAMSSGGTIRGGGARYFGAVEVERRSSGSQSLLADMVASEEMLGVSRDSLQKLGQILSGFGLLARRVAPLDKPSSNWSALGRLTFPHGNDGVTELRINGFGVESLALFGAPFLLGTPADQQSRVGIESQLGITSHTETGNLNELRFGTSISSVSSRPVIDIPRGEIVLASELPNGVSGASEVSFGGSGQPTARRTSAILEAREQNVRETSDKLHRLTIGGELRMNFFRLENDGSHGGSFFFPSLAALSQNAPASFQRQNFISNGVGSESSGTGFVSDRWKLSNRIRAQLGVRLEAELFDVNSPIDEDLQRSLGATPASPRSARLSPRMGVAWNYGTSHLGAPLGTISGSVGEYRGMLALSDLVFTASSAPLTLTPALTCYGTNSPRPDWSSYLNAAGFPTECITGPSSLGGSAPSVSFLGKGLEPPRSWRGNLQWRFSPTATSSLTLGGLLTRGYTNASIVDLNRVKVGRFSLPDEDGRLVFTAPSDILQTGVAVISSSRIDQRFAQVLERRSDLRSRGAQITANLTIHDPFFLPGFWNVSYALSRFRDQARGFPTDGTIDPERPSWGQSAYERRHQILIRGGLTRSRLANLFAIIRISSGVPFTPTVAGDINGDGFGGDPAFVFNPSFGSDTTLGRQLLAIQEHARPFVKKCLSEQLGKLAQRNSCSGQWTTSIDVNATMRPEHLPHSDRTSISLYLSNLAAGADQLLHGSRGLRGWGQPILPDQTLLVPTGFDPVSRAYKYVVNPHFGSTAGSLGSFFNPFRIAVEIKVLLGPNPSAQLLLEQLGREPGHKGPPRTAEQLKMNLINAAPNPVDLALQAADTAALTTAQIERLKALGVAYTSEIEQMWNPVVSELTSVGKVDTRRGVRALNEGTKQMQRIQFHWAQEIKRILAPTQQMVMPLYLQHLMFDPESETETLIADPFGR